MSGHFATGPDIGGFRDDPSPELFARWIQLGVFYPFMRTHSAKFASESEPWSYGTEVEELSRVAIHLRYRLLPYIYTYFREACQIGVPLMRPMWYEFPKDPKCVTVENSQFMFGPALLVAPAFAAGQRERELYLPEGIWYNYYTNEEFSGGQYIVVPAPLEHIPLFVRGDTILPVYKIVGKNVYETRESGIDFLHFGENATGLLYLDDGDTLAFQEGSFGLYRILQDDSLELLEGSGFADF